MARRKWIRTVEDLAAHLGVEATEEALSRALYKNTECGAWLKLVTGDVTKVVSERWHLALNPSVAGLFVFSVKRGGVPNGTAGYRDPKDANMPQELIDYCLLVRHESNNPNIDGKWKINGLTLRDLQGIVKGDHADVLTGTTLSTTVAVKKKVGEKQGIMVGSIVEGSDAEATPQTLFFPFTIQAFNGAVAAVEADVQGIIDFEASLIQDLMQD